MKKIVRLSLFIGSFLFTHFVHADYYYYGRDLNGWEYIDNQTILLYQGNTPKVLVKLWSCYVYSHSRVQVVTDTIGDYSGKILIDNDTCEPQQVTNL